MTAAQLLSPWKLGNRSRDAFQAVWPLCYELFAHHFQHVGVAPSANLHVCRAYSSIQISSQINTHRGGLTPKVSTDLPLGKSSHKQELIPQVNTNLLLHKCCSQKRTYRQGLTPQVLIFLLELPGSNNVRTGTGGSLRFPSKYGRTLR